MFVYSFDLNESIPRESLHEEIWLLAPVLCHARFFECRVLQCLGAFLGDKYVALN